MSTSSNATPALLDVSNVSKSFGAVEVLRSVSLRVARGEVVTVIGPSGSGKTTLLRCVNFLESYDGGSIRIDGKEVGYRDGGTRQRRSERDLAAMRAETGMVFQSFNLFPHLTAAGNIMLGLTKVRGKTNADARAIAEHGSAGSASPTRPTAFPPNSPAVSSSVSASPVQWRWDRRSCCSTR